MTIESAVEQDFAAIIAPYRREIFSHCYRMMGSVHEAEDLVQETLLRAWKGYAGFTGASSVRTWIHRIATNTCLTALESRQKRPLPTGLGAPASGPDDLVEADMMWLEPAPDAVLDSRSDPGTLAEWRESVRLAFIAALQHLPPRQRAVLVLRDVLSWRAAEVAEATGVTVATVNSLLQRARRTIADLAPTREALVEPASPDERAVLDRFVAGFENYDVDGLVELFTDSTVWEMPPFQGWYQGAQTIGALIARNCPATGPGEMVLVPTRANGQPAFGVYMRGEDGVHRRFHLQVVDVDGDRIAHVVAFFDTTLFDTFGLPAELDRR
ncbi:sigma-70 family RNA polymerase sigma factor [Ruania alba]|uniref:RNA polymerase sigma factor n=1 Tax=Ruania alba TaxID=648782 RepID=A0A1H5E4B9_9MICO|nr:sigma-70 family RNA polymerase sigma factor [Ruania alba]SED85903.1 RNA polymerase, sigma subunit, ECF family [Ruania alba]